MLAGIVLLVLGLLSYDSDRGKAMHRDWVRDAFAPATDDEALLDLPPAERAGALLTGPDAPHLETGAAVLVGRLLAVSLTGDGR